MLEFNNFKTYMTQLNESKIKGLKQISIKLEGVIYMLA